LRVVEAEGMMSPGEVETSSVEELVARYEVCWEVWPEYTFVGHEKRQIGFQLELSGTHGPCPEHPEPGCEECQKAYSALRRIAENVLQPEGDCAWQIEPYDQGIHFSRRHGNRPEVSLTIRILHGTGLQRPVDSIEIHCLNEAQQHLEKLGAARRR
jgi:hypothetical protein